MDVNAAIQNQVKNIEKRTGKSFAELEAIVKSLQGAKHLEIVTHLKSTLGIGHGDANTLTHVVMKSHGAAAAEGKPLDEVLAEIYAGSKAGLRPISDAFMSRLEAFGPFEISPKKGYLSLRRKRQFAMIGPGSNTRVDVGLNMKGDFPGSRIETLPAGGMCQFKVKVENASQVDDELMSWVKTAYDAAG